MTTSHRNLIISPIGDDSAHRSWVSGPGERTFDLLLIYYGDREDFGRAEATWYERRKGFKWELLHWALHQHRDVVDRYANIWLPDCDIKADTLSINRMFELFEHYGLQMAQPAIASGEVSYQSLRQQPGVVLRYTPFVEVMCPLFTRGALARVEHTFSESRSGWGLDWVWPRFFESHQVAILDAVGIEHTGRLFRGESYQRLAALGVHPSEDFERVTKRYGGFPRRLHRRLVRGTIRLPAIRESGFRQGWLARLFGWRGMFGWRMTG
jgi:hypothetical protein